MATLTATFNWYEQASELLSDGTIDLDNDSFEVTLHTSSYTPDAANDSAAADLTNELSSAGGYAAAALTGVTWTRTGGTTAFSSDNPTWTASGADFDPARYWVLRDTTADRLIAYGLLDNTPADVTLTDGNSLTITISSWFEATLTGA